MRSWNRRSCSSSLTENQYFTRTMPEWISISSNSGQERRNSRYSSSVQKPITCSTPARLYQDRSNSTISPPDGRCSTYRWKYHCDFSFSVGVPSATTRTTRGLVRSTMRLMVPPLPGGVAALEEHADLQLLVAHPLLQLHQLALQVLHPLLVRLVGELRRSLLLRLVLVLVVGHP